MNRENTYGDSVLLATAGYDHTIKFWQPHSGTCTKTVPHSESQVNALAFLPESSSASLHIAAAGFQHIRLYDINSSNPQPTTKYEDLSKNVTSVGFHADGRWMYSTGEDCSARIWDLGKTASSGASKKVLSDAPVNCSCLHPNQVDLIFGDQNGIIHLWDLRHRERKKDETLRGQNVTSISIDPEGTNMAAVTDQGVCYIWNLQSSTTGSQISTKMNQSPKQKLNAHRTYALKCLFSPDSTMLATSSADATIRIWKMVDFSLVATLTEESQRWVWDIAFSDDARYIISASSDNYVRLWDIDTGKVERKYEGHTKAVTSLAFRDSQ